MDFSYSDEQQMLQDSVQKFVQNRYDFETRRKILESDKGYSEQYWRQFAGLGWLTVAFAEEDGGFGGRAVDLMVIMEELGKAVVVEPLINTTVLGGGMIGELGNAGQKQSVLEPVMRGELQLACAYAEAGSRYNLASVRTTARRDGEHYILDGKKIVVLNGPHADKLVVVARTDGEERDSSGVTALIVDAGAEGVSRNNYRLVDGQSASEIRFDSVCVPLANRLGEEGEALPALERAVDRASLAICSEALGALDSLLWKTVEYSRTRKQFGTAIGTFQALQHRMVDMFIECQMARSIVIRAAMRLDSQASDTDKQKAVSAAKSRVGKAARRVGQEAVQLHGGIAMTDELDVGHLFKRVTAIEKQFGSTDHHLRRYAAL